VWGRIIGVPGDVAGGIHTFFKVLGLRAGIEAEAYSAAAAEGLTPTQAQFWDRRNYHAANPSEEALQRSVDGAYKGTFMQELGPKGKAFQRFGREIPGWRWVLPFAHIPINLMKATYEYTPFAVLDSNMRADIFGKNGGRAQDMAIARLVAGSAVMAWFVNAQMTGKATGDYPLDPKERDAWKLRGTQPNSILIGNEWVSFDRFGPAGDLARLGANIGSVVSHLTSDDDDAMGKATVYAANAAARTIIDEVGFTTLQNLFEAYHDEKKGTAFLASTAGSLIPFSSLLRQTASAMDPDMREAHTIIDGLKYYTPGLRETLLPKRDWSGAPIPNPGYGGDLPVPGVSAILRHGSLNVNPVDMEMERLGIHPAPPQDRIGGVKLPPRLYDQYQVSAGILTREVLDNLVSQPTWHEIPVFARQEIFRRSISQARQQAAAMLQAAYPQIIKQGVENAINRINGTKPTKLQDATLQ
jgi:hypothetical protein